jgi:hypothetical protein
VWLANDFIRERARHAGFAKKISKAIDGYHSTKEIRKAKKAKV